ncbi:hypothetical protein CC78DRAFT_586339 [Lojkania enalia]|uniref:Uncharacterized protein n=1 Tax=Lojkania enalia TaxID=147567 RepID=A0A9P4K444_9PLEO|nr:hypothetical protein CC78DRAFT_586339 [Didymosphaeria enalia]
MSLRESWDWIAKGEIHLGTFETAPRVLGPVSMVSSATRKHSDGKAGGSSRAPSTDPKVAAWGNEALANCQVVPQSRIRTIPIPKATLAVVGPGNFHFPPYFGGLNNSSWQGRLELCSEMESCTIQALPAYGIDARSSWDSGLSAKVGRSEGSLVGNDRPWSLLHWHGSARAWKEQAAGPGFGKG